jgi:hypothetical protein
MHLDRVWLAIRTKNIEDAGTGDPLELLITDHGIDRLQTTLGPADFRHPTRGGATLYELHVAPHNIVPENLTDSSIRVGIRGDDQWQPEDLFVWGRRLTGGEGIPLAIETDITAKLSLEIGGAEGVESVSSIPLRRVGLGDRAMEINRLFMLMETSLSDDSGTDDTITLRIFTPGLVVDFDVPPGGDTSQEDLEEGEANFYEVPVITPFTKNSIVAMRLEINGDDAWLPRNFFLFGLKDAVVHPHFPTRRPALIVPLVHLPEWEFGFMSTGVEGVTQVLLPLAPTP